MEFKGSRTEKNLMEAFAGESQARNKYSYYASKAKKDGFEQISAIFSETADNEKEHAKMWFKLFHGIGTTEENLLDAAAGEHEEWVKMYKEFADIAREEGFIEIAVKLDEKEKEEVWVCRNCGHIAKGKSAPSVCPTCDHPQAYFELRKENY